MKRCHLDPAAMSWRASLQPLMTRGTAKVAGWLRLKSCRNLSRRHSECYYPPLDIPILPLWITSIVRFVTLM